ncbi:hypothetical protein BH20PSE1_BH20PSE1_08350 [soil metagenome]
MGHCLSHGKYDGWRCPVCDVAEAANQAGKAAASAAEKAASESREATEAAFREAADRTAEAIREAAEVDRAAAKEAAERMQEEQERTHEAIERGIEEHERIARDSWKLEADAKVDRAIQLASASLHAEAASLCRDALKQDPGNIYGYGVLAAQLAKLGDQQGSMREMLKGIQLLGTGEWTTCGPYSSLLFWLPEQATAEVIGSFKAKVKRFATEFPASILPKLIEAVAARGWNDEVIALVRSVPLGRQSNLVGADLVGTLARLKRQNAAAILAQRLAVVAGSEKDVERWVHAICWCLDLYDRTGEGDPKPGQETISGWTHVQATELASYLVAHRSHLERSFSPDTVEDLIVIAGNLYKRTKRQKGDTGGTSSPSAAPAKEEGLSSFGVVLGSLLVVATLEWIFSLMLGDTLWWKEWTIPFPVPAFFAALALAVTSLFLRTTLRGLGAVIAFLLFVGIAIAGGIKGNGWFQDIYARMWLGAGAPLEWYLVTIPLKAFFFLLTGLFGLAVCFAVIPFAWGGKGKVSTVYLQAACSTVFGTGMLFFLLHSWSWLRHLATLYYG